MKAYNFFSHIINHLCLEACRWNATTNAAMLSYIRRQMRQVWEVILDFGSRQGRWPCWNRGLRTKMSRERRPGSRQGRWPCWSRGLRAKMSRKRRPRSHHGRWPCRSRGLRAGMSRERWLGSRHGRWHGIEDAGGALEDQGFFGFGQGVRAVGAVCGGSWPRVAKVRAFLAGAGGKRTRSICSRNSSTYRSNLRPACRKSHSASSDTVILL